MECLQSLGFQAIDFAIHSLMSGGTTAAPQAGYLIGCSSVMVADALRQLIKMVILWFQFSIPESIIICR